MFSDAAHKYVGHDQLRGQIAERLASGRRSQHIPTNLLLKREDDHVLGSCYCVIIGSTPEGPELRTSGFYKDRIVQEDGRWLFAARRFQHWP